VHDPPVCVVVPSLDGDVGALLRSVERQTVQPHEVEVVTGVRPSGRARNLGVCRTTAPIVVFVDDDAVLGGDDTIANLLAPFSDPAIGVTGAAKVLPPDSSWFQRMVARQVPRIEHPVVATLTPADPPLDRFGYTAVTTTCCAVRRDVLEACGGFDEDLVRGVDSEFFVRVAEAGHRIVLAAETWAFHPAPASVGRLVSKHFLYGVGYAQEVQRHPERAAGRYLSTPAHAAAYLVVRTALVAPHAVLPYSHADPTWRPGLKPLRALTSYTAALGYVYGWYRHHNESLDATMNR
jgi:cellulose synthase/poly-beta-1,6-N-acetylglucosamine synthase-like glycosyltransferase